MSEPYTIGSLARAGGVPVSTVRYYERRGLLAPASRTGSRYRIYDRSSLRRLRFLRLAQEMGFTLNDIGRLLELREAAEGCCSETEAILAERLRATEERIAQLEQARATLEASLEWCRSDHVEGHCPVLEDLEARALDDTREPGPES